MGSLSNYAENELLDHVFNAAYTPVTTVYLGLCTADPTDAGTGASMNEVANSNAYARTAITFGAASSRRSTQSAVVTFPEATGSWGTVTHWAVVDNATYGNGNMLCHGAFSNSKSIVDNNTPSFASGEVYIEITASTGMSNYLAHKLLDLMFKNTAYSVPDTYMLLMTTTPNDSSTGSSVTEPSGGAYARKQVNTNGGSSPKWNLAASGSVSNANQIDFTTPTGSWGTVTHVGIADASTSGNLLYYAAPTGGSQAVGSGDPVNFAASGLVINQS